MSDGNGDRPDPLARYASTPVELQERLVAERSGTPHLIYRDGEGRQVIRMLAGVTEPLTIGRFDECDISIGWDAEVSRLHAALEVTGPHWTIVDEGLSRNGSYINGKRLPGRRRLADGDMIGVGQTTLVFRSPGRSRGDTTTPSGNAGVAATLTPTDRRLLVALCRPLKDSGQTLPASNQAIADELHLAVPAVKKRLTSLFLRFGLEHVPQAEKRLRLAVIALETGIVIYAEL
jgi:pSer/pThr/pTyr-binding forkhead associated (FHA) protein